MAVIEGATLQPLQDLLDGLLAPKGWTEAGLDATGEELEERKARITALVSSFEALLHETAPPEASAEWRAATGVEVTRFKGQLHGVQQDLQRHRGAVLRRAVIADVQGPVTMLQQRLQARASLQLDVKNQIRQWGAFISSVASQQGGQVAEL